MVATEAQYFADKTERHTIARLLRGASDETESRAVDDTLVHRSPKAEPKDHTGGHCVAPTSPLVIGRAASSDNTSERGESTSSSSTSPSPLTSGWCWQCNMWARYSELEERIRFYEVRRTVLRHHHLPRDFPFATYLRVAKQHIFLELVEVPDSAWVTLAWFLSLDLLLRGSVPGYFSSRGNALLQAVLPLCAVVVAVSVTLASKVRAIYDTLTDPRLRLEITDGTGYNNALGREGGNDTSGPPLVSISAPAPLQAQI